MAHAVQTIHTTRFLPPEVIVRHPRRWGRLLLQTLRITTRSSTPAHTRTRMASSREMRLNIWAKIVAESPDRR